MALLVVVFLYISYFGVLQISAYDLSNDERVIDCVDLKSIYEQKVIIQLDRSDQNYADCLHTCWNLGQKHFAIKPGCDKTECICMNAKPASAKECDSKLFEDCSNKKSIPIFYAAVQNEDYSIMECAPGSEIDQNLPNFKKTEVTSVAACLEECTKDPPHVGKDSLILAGINAIRNKLQCRCSVKSRHAQPQARCTSSSRECYKPANENCGIMSHVALYYTDKPLHIGTDQGDSSRSIAIISILVGIFVVFLLVLLAIFLRHKLRKGIPLTNRSVADNGMNKGNYQSTATPPSIVANKVIQPVIAESPKPIRSAPPPPPPASSNKPQMPVYQNPHTPPGAYKHQVQPTKKPQNNFQKQTMDDAGYVSPSVIKSNKFSAMKNSPQQTHSGYLKMENNSNNSSFSSIRALFDPSNGGGKSGPQFKSSPLVGTKLNIPTASSTPSRNDNNPSSQPTPQKSPCYMNSKEFFN